MKVSHVTPRRSLMLGTAFCLIWGMPMMAQAGSGHDSRDSWNRGEGPQGDVFQSRSDRDFHRNRDTRGHDYYDPDYRGARDYRGDRDYRGTRDSRDFRDTRDYRDTRDFRDDSQDKYYTDQYGDVDTMEEQEYDRRRDDGYRSRDPRSQDRYRSTSLSSSRESQTDRRLKSEIQQELEDLRGQGNRIDVQARNGIVTLMGTVEDRDTMVDAEKSAYDSGARKVVNNLRVSGQEERPWAEMGDNELKKEIEDELWWSPFVTSDRIQVRVQDGVAILQGDVEDKSEMAAAVKNAYEGGARRVVNQLRTTQN